MIDLYTWPTPNGHKVHIMLEECKLEYNVHPVDIGAGEQFKPEFLAISPNNKIPAMVDQQGPDGKPFVLAESGAMLFYLASKTGKFLPKDLKKRWQVMQWMMTQMGHVGPMCPIWNITHCITSQRSRTSCGRNLPVLEAR